MSLEIDKLRNNETVVILNNTTGEVRAVYSFMEVLDYIQEVKEFSKLIDFFDEEELEIIRELQDWNCKGKSD